MPDPQAIVLNFPDFVRVAGETLQGYIDLDLGLAAQDKIEKVKIKLRGSVLTRTTERTHAPGQEAQSTTHYRTQNHELVRLDQVLWDQSSAPQGLPSVIQCPFQLPLPPNLPPSFHYSHSNHTVTVSYSIEVVGSRHGVFHANRRVRKIFSVVPAASPWELNTTAAIKQGWNGPWKPQTIKKEIRHGLFGDHSEATMELVLPDLPSFPMSVNVPFALHIWTKTKPVHQEDLDKNPKLFPAPPQTPADSELEVKLRRQGRMQTYGKSEHFEEELQLRGGLGDKNAVTSIRTTFDQPSFTQLDGSKGIWNRAVHFEGALVIPETPSFSGEHVEWHYTLKVKMDFPGLGNILEFKIPVHINSGVACPPLPTAPYQYNVPYTYPLPSGPPPLMHLPQSYWSGEHHNWDEENGE
ncbi:Arrestin-N domain-containing protein [Mycena indigotica]|uniref:Arrestin-N domain-containing protein n=1 Tax=Mycena indigotica TaxID=2126181 RepID=A0A8H6WHF9_9AGAR|nr:Arrestin-N domain-containing protein [Mycena indigotica]KAF7315033.1 Arrestin-N domain-containing protein [Mycena indigotica]